MLTAIRTRLSYANVVATITLFIALGGGAYAAATLPKNSVGAKQIKKNAVTSSKIKRNAVTSSKVKNRSLLRKDFRAGQLPAGPPGAPGTPATVARTRLHFSDVATVASTGQYQLVKAVGQFAKRQPDTTIRMTWNGVAMADFHACEYQLRVDGANDVGSTSTAFSPDSGANGFVPNGGQAHGITVVGVFGGLAPGEHTVSIWARDPQYSGGGYPCTVNASYAPVGQDVFVEEQP